MNKTEKKSMELVMKYERKQGRKPIDVSHKRIGYDVKSNNRYIEVKGKSQGDKIPQWVNMYKKLISKLGKKIMRYYIYVVYDLKKEPKLIIFPPQVVLSNLEIDVNFIFHPNQVKKKNPEIKAIKL